MPQTVLITGASSGFGREAALLFRQRGWNVAATMRSPATASIWAVPAGIFTTRLDVTDANSIESAVQDVLARFGPIDVVVNNAGFALMGPLEGVAPSDLLRQFETNVLGMIAVTQAVLPGMRAAHGGVIVNMSSMGGRLTLPLLAAYHSSKFAVEGLTEALQYELAPHGIRVKLIEPGAANTNFAGSSMTRTPHPAYTSMMSGIRQIFRANAERLPGPAKVAETIFIAATDGSKRLRYPVIATSFMLARRVLGERGWRAAMDFVVRRSMKSGEGLDGGAPPSEISRPAATGPTRDI